MNVFAILTISAVLAGSPDLRSEIAQQIRTWVPGQDLPPRLLSYPDGKISENDSNTCGMASDLESVQPLIRAVEDDRLLEEVVFDRRSDSTTFHAAVVRLVERKGLPWFSNVLSRRDATRWELDGFRQMFQTPFANISVAFIKRGVMPDGEARSALLELKRRLDNGEAWSDAYRKVADKYPDNERRELEPEVAATLVGYWFSGWVSSLGFSFNQLQITPYVPAKLFQGAIDSGRGGHLVVNADGTYLLFVLEIMAPKA